MPKPCCKNCEYFVVEADGLSWCMMTCENVKEDGKCEEFVWVRDEDDEGGGERKRITTLY